jgi:two-component system phosphate regulon response regulator PhoB
VIAERPDPLVLVADDDRDTRELYRACFDTNGYRTAEAGTGSQAIVAAVDIVPDVLVTDYILPDINGIAIARRLREDVRTAGIGILMVTGFANPDLIRHAASAGVDRVFHKPCLPQIVMREVSRVLTRRARPFGKSVPAATLGVETRLDVHAVSRVRDEFAALPGLSLTPEQARLVFELDRETCERVLDVLVNEGFLSRTMDGSLRRPRA